jgi:hypothetical protein
VCDACASSAIPTLISGEDDSRPASSGVLEPRAWEASNGRRGVGTNAASCTSNSSRARSRAGCRRHLGVREATGLRPCSALGGLGTAAVRGERLDRKREHGGEDDRPDHPQAVP